MLVRIAQRQPLELRYSISFILPLLLAPNPHGSFIHHLQHIIFDKWNHNFEWHRLDVHSNQNSGVLPLKIGWINSHTQAANCHFLTGELQNWKKKTNRGKKAEIIFCQFTNWFPPNTLNRIGYLFYLTWLQNILLFNWKSHSRLACKIMKMSVYLLFDKSIQHITCLNHELWIINVTM